MYNQPDPFQDILRYIEEMGYPMAPAPKPGSDNQPKCEEAQAFDSVAAGAAELLKSQLEHYLPKPDNLTVDQTIVDELVKFAREQGMSHEVTRAGTMKALAMIINNIRHASIAKPPESPKPTLTPEEIKALYPYPLVRIEWLDSRQLSSSWEFVKDQKTAACKCVSYGWLIRETEDSVTVAPNAAGVGDNMQTSGHITIPAKAITSKTMFSEAHGQLTTK